MKIEFDSSFLRDIKRITDKQIRTQAEKAIKEIEGAVNLTSITKIKKLKGEKNYYRIRIADYRVGFRLVDGKVIFERMLHRKEIYRYYPPKK